MLSLGLRLLTPNLSHPRTQIKDGPVATYGDTSSVFQAKLLPATSPMSPNYPLAANCPTVAPSGGCGSDSEGVWLNGRPSGLWGEEASLSRDLSSVVLGVAHERWAGQSHQGLCPPSADPCPASPDLPTASCPQGPGPSGSRLSGTFTCFPGETFQYTTVLSGTYIVCWD